MSRIRLTPLESQVKMNEVLVGLAVPKPIIREWIAEAACAIANALLAHRSKEVQTAYSKALYALQLALSAIGGKQGGRPPIERKVSSAKRKG